MGKPSLSLWSQKWQALPWKTRVSMMAVLLLVLAITALFVVRAVAIGRLRAEAHALQVQQVHVAQEITDLQAQRAKQNDPATMEYLARAKLGMTKLGEIKYILIEGNH